MIRTVRKDYPYCLASIAIALALSFVVHDVERTHEHPFAPYAHSHEGQTGHSQQHEQSDASVQVYTHGERKDFLALLLLIAAIPVVALFENALSRIGATRSPLAVRRTVFDYHRLLFRRGILHTKRH